MFHRLNLNLGRHETSVHYLGASPERLRRRLKLALDEKDNMAQPFKILFVVAIAICALTACDWLRGGTYSVINIDTTLAPERLTQDQRDFFEIIDVISKRRGMKPTSCAPGVAEKSTCRTYVTDKGVFLNGFLDQKAKQYVVSVYEWNVNNRSPLALEIEKEVLSKLRARFGENVVALHHDGV